MFTNFIRTLLQERDERIKRLEDIQKGYCSQCNVYKAEGLEKEISSLKSELEKKEREIGDLRNRVLGYCSQCNHFKEISELKKKVEELQKVKGE